jgi:hypothetical protein
MKFVPVPAQSVAIAAMALAAVSGCGGGGAGSDAVHDGPYNVAHGFDVRALLASYLEGGRTTVMTGYGYNDNTATDNDLFEVTFIYEPPVSEPFPVTGAPARKMTRSGSYTTASQTAASVMTTEEIFFGAQGELIGLRFPGALGPDGCYRVVSTSALPSSVFEPAFGEVAALSVHSPCSDSVGTPGAPSSQLRWRITTEDGFPLFCLSLWATISGSSGEFCFEAKADNTLGPRARFWTPLYGTITTLTVRNYGP